MTSHTEQPGHRSTKTLETVTYDPTEIEKEKRRQRALGIDAKLRYSIDTSLAQRVGVMRRIRSE